MELLKLFGIHVSDSAHVSDNAIAFHGISLGTALLVALIVVGATVFVYLRTAPQLSRVKKWTLAFFRSLLLCMILLLLMRPVLLLTVEGTIRRTLLILVDGSASMQIKDLRQDSEDLKRAAIARGLLDAKKGLSQTLPGNSSSFNAMSRSDVVKAMLSNPQLDLLDKLGKEYDLSVYTFGQTLQALSSEKTPASGEKTSDASFLNTISFDKPYTAIGDAVSSLLDLKRGQPLAGIFLITDGGNNYGSQPTDAAALAQQDKVPLYIYAVGITLPHDIIVSQIFAPAVTFAKEEAPVSVLVHSQAMKGRTAKLVLKLGGEVVDSKDITFGADGEMNIPMKFTPPKSGNFELEASIDPLPDEAVKDNNKVSQRVRVIDGKIQVLYIEEKPRWEFRYLQALLVRDRRLDAKFILREGSRELSSAKNSPYLADLPATREDWMKYDVIILGDVDSHIFTNDQMRYISDLVSSNGGGLLFVAGQKFMPDSYRRTILEGLFPVQFEDLTESTHEGSVGKPIPLRLTEAGQNSTMMRLADKEDENLAIWKKLPGVYWDAKVLRAKPAAEVLLTDPSPEKITRSGAMPVVALQSYGAGQVLYVGTDETWRWRLNVGEKYFTRFWGQSIMRLGLPRLLGASKLTQLSTDRKNYVSGDQVIISGKLYRNGSLPLVASVVHGTVTIKPDHPGAGGEIRKDVSLQSAPGKPGFYQGELVVTTPGIYDFSTENDPSAVLDFRVSEPRFEFGETAMNLPLLQKMAASSGGAVYREEDLYKMLIPASDSGSSSTSGTPSTGSLLGSVERIPSPQEVELGFTPLYYALMILVATIEWVLRKIWRLK